MQNQSFFFDIKAAPIMQVMARAERATEEPHLSLVEVLSWVSEAISVSLSFVSALLLSVEVFIPGVAGVSFTSFDSAASFKILTSRTLRTERSVALSIIAFIAR